MSEIIKTEKERKEDMKKSEENPKKENWRESILRTFLANH